MTPLKTFLITLIVGLFVVGVSVVFAEEVKYVPLVYLPGFGADKGAISLADFVNRTYQIIVALGALVGVIKIAIAGVKYSMSDVITDKASAKKDILGVLLGLAILLMPWIVLNTIYPNLLNLDFTEKMQEEQVLVRDVHNQYMVVDTFTGDLDSPEYETFKKRCLNSGGYIKTRTDENEKEVADCYSSPLDYDRETEPVYTLNFNPLCRGDEEKCDTECQEKIADHEYTENGYDPTYELLPGNESGTRWTCAAQWFNP